MEQAEIPRFEAMPLKCLIRWAESVRIMADSLPMIFVHGEWSTGHSDSGEPKKHCLKKSLTAWWSDMAVNHDARCYSIISVLTDLEKDRINAQRDKRSKW